MMVKFYQVETENLLNSKEFEEGSLYFCIDTRKIYLDPIEGMDRLLITGDLIVLATEDERENILAPIPNKIYYVASSAMHYIYNNGEWNNIGSGISSNIDIDTTLSQSGKAADAASVGMAIKSKVDSSGWLSNKYLGTDNYGNIIEKDSSNAMSISVSGKRLIIKNNGTPGTSNINYKPVIKTDAMTVPVGVDSNGQLWTVPTASSNDEADQVDRVPVESISIDYETITIGIDSSLQLNATIIPENATDKKLEWYSSNEDIAAIDDSGIITGIAEGNCRIMVSASSGAYVEIPVTVELNSEWDEEWDYSMGLPEDNGFIVNDTSLASLDDNGLLISAGYKAESGVICTTGKLILEVEYAINTVSWSGWNSGFAVISPVYSTNDVVRGIAFNNSGNGIGIVGNDNSSTDVSVPVHKFDGTSGGLIRIEVDIDAQSVKYYRDGILLGDYTDYEASCCKIISVTSAAFLQKSAGTSYVKAFRIKVK